jgi:hypothetical protein
MACADVATAKAKAAKAINLIILSLPCERQEGVYGAFQRRNLEFWL